MLKKGTALIILVLIVAIGIVSFTEKENDAISHTDILVNENEELLRRSSSQQRNSNNSKFSKRPQNIESSKPDYVVQCESPFSTLNLEEHEARLSYFESLANSSVMDNQLAYAMFAKPPKGKSQLDLLLSFNHSFPKNSTALMEIMGICVSQVDNNECSQNLVDMAVAADGNNGAMWLQIVYFHANRKNNTETLSAIQELIKSPYFQESHYKIIQFYVNALEGSTTNNRNNNVIVATAIAETNTSGFSSVLKWCRNGTASDNQTAHACLQLGINMERRSKTIINSQFGMGLQRFIYQAENNQDAYAEVENRSKNYMLTRQYLTASTLMFYDEELLHFWFNNVAEYGEREANKLLVDEAILLSKNEDYYPCR